MPVIRIPLVGESYTPRSTAVGAQTTINLYVEQLEDPNEKEKNTAVLFGTPGKHLFKDMSTIDAGFMPLRGIWSGAGRCFVAGGTKYCEIDSSGNLVGSVRTISNAAVNGLANSPVQFFPNGNSLFIIAGGVAYVDNGFGPVAVTLAPFAGVADTNVLFGQFSVIWKSGDMFDPSMGAGTSITINAVVYTILAYLTSTVLLLTTSAGTQTDVAYSAASPPLGAVTGSYVGSYYLISRPSSKQYNFSEVNDANGATWNGLDFNTKNTYPDALRCLLGADQVYLFGTDSTDIHDNTGPTADSSSPFQKIDGAGFRIGAVSPWSPIITNGKIFFIGSNSDGKAVAYVLNGFTPVRISTHAEEAQWAAANLGPNCVAFSEEYEGHSWVIWNFGSQTWQYDITNGVWSQRYRWTGSAFAAYQMQYHTYVPEFGDGKHLVCGNADAKVYHESLDFYDDAGADIAWQRTLPAFYANGRRQYFGRLTLEMETGTAPSGNPNITLDYSDDRGATYVNPRTASIGVLGDKGLRVFWPANGSSFDRIFRVTGVGQYKTVLISLDMDIRIGAA